VGFLFTERAALGNAAQNSKEKMKVKTKKVPARFGPEARFAVTPVPAAPFRGTQETEIERLKRRLLRETLETATKTELYAPLRHAANEAAALAWTTPFPLLVLPVLFEEKVQEARRYIEHQQAVRRRCQQELAA
jgi:hypothetical protein